MRKRVDDFLPVLEDRAEFAAALIAHTGEVSQRNGLTRLRPPPLHLERAVIAALPPQHPTPAKPQFVLGVFEQYGTVRATEFPLRTRPLPVTDGVAAVLGKDEERQIHGADINGYVKGSLNDDASATERGDEMAEEERVEKEARANQR